MCRMPLRAKHAHGAYVLIYINMNMYAPMNMYMFAWKGGILHACLPDARARVLYLSYMSSVCVCLHVGTMCTIAHV